MKEKITPCLWFDGLAREAAALYCSAFSNTRVTSQSQIVTGIDVSGHSITLLDGGPMYKPNPSISFRYLCESKEELDKVVMTIGKEGAVLGPGWIIDKFGIAWQPGIGAGRKITPNLIFDGRAAEARRFYSEIFKTDDLEAFTTSDDKGHSFPFTEGVSLTVHCESQDEIDYYWDRFTDNGGEESMCGWLKDKFGVSWQIIPVILTRIMSDPAKASKAARAFMSMRKLNIEQIVQASIS